MCIVLHLLIADALLSCLYFHRKSTPSRDPLANNSFPKEHDVTSFLWPSKDPTHFPPFISHNKIFWFDEQLAANLALYVRPQLKIAPGRPKCKDFDLSSCSLKCDSSLTMSRLTQPKLTTNFLFHIRLNLYFYCYFFAVIIIMCDLNWLQERFSGYFNSQEHDNLHQILFLERVWYSFKQFFWSFFPVKYTTIRLSSNNHTYIYRLWFCGSEKFTALVYIVKEQNSCTSFTLPFSFHLLFI